MKTVKTFLGAAVMAGAIASFSTSAFAADTQIASYSNVGDPSGHIVWLKNTDGAPVNYTAVSGEATQVGPNGTGGYIFTTTQGAGPGGGPLASGNAIGAIDTSFFFHLADLGLPVSGLAAKFTLFGQATNGNPADCASTCTTGKSIEQGGINGGFSFVYSGPTQTIGAFTFHAGDNLLSGSFTNAYISGKVGSSAPAYTAEDLILSGDVAFNSDFLAFDSMSLDAIKLTIGGATPTLGRTAPGQALNSFRSVTTGEFHSNPEPKIPGVPEPGTWALMIMGFGGAGAMLRSRRRLVAA